MSLEQAIHQRWSDDPPLAALLPAERLLTGLAPAGTAVPYAVLTRESTRPRAHTSSGTRLDDVLVRITLHASTLDSAKRIASAVNLRFDRTTFPLSSGTVRLMQRVGLKEEVRDDAAWTLELQYSALVENG